MIDHFLDIYSKLVIAVISFIAPVTSYLLSTYLGDREKILKRLEEQKTSIDLMLEAGMRQTDTNNLGARKIFEIINKRFHQMETELDHNLSILTFLNPKPRIAVLFGSLFLSIIFLLADSLVRGNLFNTYHHKTSVVLLTLSVIFFVYAIASLREIAWKLIDAKEIIILENKKINLTAESPIVEQGNVSEENISGAITISEVGKTPE